MSTITGPARMVRTRPSGRQKALLRIVPPVLLVATGLGVLGLRLSTQPTASHPATTAAGHFVPLPSSPAIETGWGIRFTAVLLEADRGIIDIRYQVVDPAKSGRIHGGKAGVDPQAQLASLPALVLESSSKKITATSAMMHFEHFHFQTELLGSTYSILYGNSGGLLHLGDKITIHMADGLKLEHIVVAN